MRGLYEAYKSSRPAKMIIKTKTVLSIIYLNLKCFKKKETLQLATIICDHFNVFLTPAKNVKSIFLFIEEMITEADV